MTEAVTETKEYYSPAGNYSVRITRGQIVQTGDGYQRIGEKFADFQPRAAGDYGRFATDDPEVIAFLDKCVQDGSGMVLTTEQFVEKTTPDHVKVQSLRQKVAEMEAELRNNRLASQMQPKKTA